MAFGLDRACWLYRLVETIVGLIGGSREACLRVIDCDFVCVTGDLIRDARGFISR